MMDPDTVSRLIAERTRLQLTVAQFAVLVGVDLAQQEAIEAGQVDQISFEYGQAIQRVGADPLFVLGHHPEPKGETAPPPSGDDAFLDAVRLLRRSHQAVEAFIGEGMAAKCPELVASTMKAALHSRRSIGPGDLEEFADKIANAIEEAGSQIADALRKPDPE